MSNKNFQKRQTKRGSALDKLLEFLGLPILRPQPVKIFEKGRTIMAAKNTWSYNYGDRLVWI